MLIIYTDGACDPNPGVGGWGVFVAEVMGTGYSVEKGAEFSGGHRNTTNNQMELQAIIEAVKLVPVGHSARILSDSMYCINGATKWVTGWARNNWRLSDKGGGGPVKNADQWRELLELKTARSLSFEWVRGHNGDAGNERADFLSRVGRFVALGKSPAEARLLASAGATFIAHARLDVPPGPTAELYTARPAPDDGKVLIRLPGRDHETTAAHAARLRDSLSELLPKGAP